LPPLLHDAGNCVKDVLDDAHERPLPLVIRYRLAPVAPAGCSTASRNLSP
jgi:hypothetical protein